jgi:hypothetical protein
MASGATLLNQNKFWADTLHAVQVGSWYDPTTCTVSASQTGEKPFEKLKATVDHCVRSQASGGARDGQNVAQNGYFLSILCMWLDHTACKVSAPRITGKSSGKTKTNFTMLGSHKSCERPKWPISLHPTGIFR